MSEIVISLLLGGGAFLIGLGSIAYFNLNLSKLKQYVTIDELHSVKNELNQKIENVSEKQNEKLNTHSNNCKHINYISKQIDQQNQNIDKQNKHIERLFDKIEELKNLFIDKLT